MNKPVKIVVPAPAPAPAQAAAAVEPVAAAPEVPAVPRGYWENADGSLVPATKVTDLDKARDRVVRELVQAAQLVSEDLARFKMLAMSEVDQFVALSAAQYGVQMRGAAGKGNVTLTTFDGRLKVEKQVADRIAFDERLQVAKSIIDECVHRWGKGSNDNIKALVNHAFKVDKAGKVSVGGVLGLRQVKIADADWLRAMDAVADSMKSVSSVAYVRFYRRNDETGEYLPISLNAAAV